MTKGFSQKVAKNVLSQAKRGDMQAFEHIYRTYSDPSISLAYRICGDRSLAQDVMQEAFIKIMTNIKNYRGDGSFAGWVRQIVCNTAFSRLKESSKLSVFDENHDTANQAQDLFSHNWIDASADLEKILQKLPKLMRAVLLLHEVEGYTHKEIAEMFEKSESFSKTTLSRAYSVLRELTDVTDRTANVFSEANSDVEINQVEEAKCI